MVASASLVSNSRAVWWSQIDSRSMLTSVEKERRRMPRVRDQASVEAVLSYSERSCSAKPGVVLG